ncbi:STAS domain-containing protein [Balneolaceae bacterium ANBcel3]|nr:STAS domain-containing protein [Balneolaceae bacterium ANBcel3]
MSLTVHTQYSENAAIITVEGSLDSATAPQLDEQVKEVVQKNPEALVLNVEKLDFMSSAGLRIIIFAKQKLGASVSLTLVKPQEQLIETLKMTGLIHSVHIVDAYP